MATRERVPLTYTPGRVLSNQTRSQLVLLPSSFAMSNDTPSAEDKAKYDTAKKELLHALAKKRALDKQLVCLLPHALLLLLTLHVLAL